MQKTFRKQRKNDFKVFISLFAHLRFGIAIYSPLYLKLFFYLGNLSKMKLFIDKKSLQNKNLDKKKDRERGEL